MGNLHFIPKGSISLPELVEMVVAELYGQDAIAEIDSVEDGEITSFEMEGQTYQQRTMYVYRAGEKVSAFEDAQRWDCVTEKIRVALSRGELPVSITTSSNQEWSIPKDYWMDEVPASLTVHSGALKNSPKPEFEDCTAYVEMGEAQKWVAALNPPEESPTSKGKRGRPITIEYEVFEETLNIHAKALGGDEWIARKTNAELAKQTRQWMGKDPSISNDGIPKQRMAEMRIAMMRTEGRLQSKK